MMASVYSFRPCYRIIGISESASTDRKGMWKRIDDEALLSDMSTKCMWGRNDGETSNNVL
jgi:hypothetical protein